MLMLYGTCEGNWYPSASTLRLSENGFGETHSTNRPMNKSEYGFGEIWEIVTLSDWWWYGIKWNWNY